MTEKINVLILIICCLFLYFIGSTSINLTDPDEVFYSETAKEMLSGNSPLTPLIFGKPQFEKPPLFYWLLMASFKVFGVSTFAARLVPALFGMIGVLGTYFFMRKLFSASASFYAALFLSASFLYFGLSKTVLTDIVFSVFMTLTLYAFYLWYRFKAGRYIILFMVLLSLAMLTKGPLSIVLSLAPIALFLVLAKDTKALRTFLLNGHWLIFLALGCSWFIYASLKYGREFTWEFFVHDNWHRILYAEHPHSDRWYFYPAVIVGGMAPWTAYLLLLGKGFKKYRKEYLFFISWASSVFLILTFAHSKLASYILPLFPAVCCALAISLDSAGARSKITVAVGIINIVLGAIPLAAIPFVAKSFPDIFRPVFSGVLLFFAFMAAGGISFILRRHKQAALLNVAALAALLLAGVSTVPARLETAFSDHGLPGIVRQYGYQEEPVLCSKIYVRGVYFYTGNPVIVLNLNGKDPFWSRHPLDVIGSEGEMRAFVNSRDRILCVLTGDDLENLNEFFGDRRRNTVISDNLNRAVVLSERLP